MKFSRERGMPILKYHLIPRTKGFIASLAALKEKCPSMLDIQLVFKPDEPNEPTVGNLLRGRGVTGYMHVRRIETKSLPDDEAAAAEWMQQLFREKDALQDSFLTHGDFFTGSGFKPVKPILQQPRLSSLLNMAFWNCATLTPILYFLIKLMLSGELMYLSIAVAIIAVCKYCSAIEHVIKSWGDHSNLIVFSFFLLLLATVHFLMQKTIGMSKISKGSSYGATDEKTKSI